MEYSLASEYSKENGVWAADTDNYKPIRKIKGFKPNPLISEDHKRMVIPFWADGKNNPDCIGSAEYWEFWDEQFDRCINGYETGGIWIPGRYYYYMNFVQITGVLGLQYPWYIDIDLEYFRTVEYIKTAKKLGLISVKARRKGLSEKGQAIINHGLRFIDSYKAGVAAGDDKYVIGFRTKMEGSARNMVNELKLHILKNNDDEYTPGYEVLNDLGSYEKESYGGQVRFATMYDKATKLEGEYFNDVVLEEAGQFIKLSEAVESIKPALMLGSYIGGTFYIYGTGGNILSSSRDFMQMYNEAEQMGFVKFWVSAKRLMFPFFGNPISLWGKPDMDSEEEEYGMPSFEGWEEHEFIGCEDVIAAERWVLRTKEKYAKMLDKRKLIKHNQSFPLSVEDAFTSSGSNNFNSENLYSQLHQIYNSDEKTTSWVLDWVYEIDKDGVKQMKYPLEVKPRPATTKDKAWEIIKIYKHPTSIKNLDVIGIDSYNQDQTKTTKSLGGICVLRRNKDLHSKETEKGIVPVCTYYSRPPRKELFYEIALKIAIYYRAHRNVMVSAEHDFIIDYFIQNGGEKYLSFRPKSFDAPNGAQENKYGAKMTGYSKPKMLGFLQTMVDDNYMYIWFEEIIRDLLAYDEANIGTDWDLADAMGYAWMRIVDMKVSPKEAIDDYEKRFFTELPDIYTEDLKTFEEKAYKENGATIGRKYKEKIMEEQLQEYFGPSSRYSQIGENSISEMLANGTVIF